MSLQAQVFVYTKFRPLGSLSADSVGNALPGYHLPSRERSQPSITKTIYRFGLVTNQRRPALVEYSYLSPPLPATLTVRESIMAKFLRPNKVVLVLKGRYAGKKAVIVKNTLHFDDGDKSTNKKFGCALIVGVERAPLKVTKSMNEKKIAKRSRVKPFVKMINYSHLMPTRYSFELEATTPISSELLKDPAKKKAIRGDLKKILEAKYKSGQSKWFFQKLRF